jgi:alpha-tubulin suppressor-like RCC1 family protein
VIKINLPRSGKILILFSSLFMAACVRPGGEPATVRFKLPQTGLSKHDLPLQKSSNSLAETSWGQGDPTTFSEIDCYAVMVSGPDLADGICANASDTEIFKVGFIAGLYPAGSEISVSVPSGDQRKIRLIGLKASSSLACNVSVKDKLPLENLSAPFELGSSTLDLIPGEVKSLEILATLTAAGRFHSCKSSIFSFGPSSSSTTNPDPVSPNGVTAVLDNLPASVSNLDTLEVGVSGNGVVLYKYKLGNEDNMDCTVSSGYGPAISINTNITDDLSGFADGPLKLCILGQDANGEVQSALTPTQFVWTKDTIAPTVEFSTPAASSYINLSTASSFNVMGTCSETGQSVVFTGDASGIATCTVGNTWSANLNLSGLGDGTVTVLVNQSDLAGNVSTHVSRSFVKDVIPPTTPTLTIDSGNTNTFSTSVTLSLAAGGAEKMYITNTAACAGDGTLESFAAIKTWFLAATNSTQTVYVKYKDVAGNSSACVSDTIEHNSPAILSLSGTTDFGDVTLGGTMVRVLTLTNVGGYPASFIVATGLSGDFSFEGGTFPGASGTCLASLAMGSSCTLAVQFTPTAAGTQSTSLFINYNDGVNTANFNPMLTGRGVSPAILSISEVSPYNYGSVALGGTASYTFTITNTGGNIATALTGSGLATPFMYSGGAFPGIGGTCSTSLPAAASCTIVVNFSPSASSIFNDTILIDYNNGIAAQQVSRDLSGTGVPPAMLSISDGPSFDFGTVPVNGFADKMFTISNSGGITATSLMGLGLTAPYSFKGGVYPGTGGDCGVNLSVGASCAVVVTFSPTTASVQMATLEINFNDGTGSQVVSRSLSGTGISSAAWNSLALGNEQSCAIDSSGTGSCWGRGTEGQLGNGSNTDSLTSMIISGGISWLQMDSFTRTLCGVASDHFAYCWGSNLDGQVGDGTTDNRSVPISLPGGGVWSKVEAGTSHSCGLRMDGSIYCWGSNAYGQLGDGTVVDKLSPQIVASASQFVDVSVGEDISCGLTSSNTIECWGQNSYGQLGDGTTTQKISPVVVGSGYTQVALGSAHGCGVKTDNSLYCWGQNTYGQLGNGTTTQSTSPVFTGTGFVQVALGSTHSCGVKSDGSLYCWGKNTYGQVGDSSNVQKNNPILVGSGYSDVFAGYSHTCGIKADNSLWCWGLNANGQLGDQTLINKSMPVFVDP